MQPENSKSHQTASSLQENKLKKYLGMIFEYINNNGMNIPNSNKILTIPESTAPIPQPYPQPKKKKLTGC